MSQESFAEKRLPGADQIDFAHVDTSAHPQQFVRYLEHTRENDQLQALKVHTSSSASFSWWLAVNHSPNRHE